MLTYSPSYGTSYVHVESGSGGTAVSVVARLPQQPNFFFHFAEMLLLQDLRVQFKGREGGRGGGKEGKGEGEGGNFPMFSDCFLISSYKT